MDRAPAHSGLFRRRIRRWLTHAGGRNNAVHAKHLSVVVGGMRKAENGQSQARIERWDRDRQLARRCESIAIVERRPGSVTQRERVFEVLKNLMFRPHVVGSVLPPRPRGHSVADPAPG